MVKGGERHGCVPTPIRKRPKGDKAQGESKKVVAEIKDTSVNERKLKGEHRLKKGRDQKRRGKGRRCAPSISFPGSRSDGKGKRHKIKAWAGEA